MCSDKTYCCHQALRRHLVLLVSLAFSQLSWSVPQLSFTLSLTKLLCFEPQIALSPLIYPSDPKMVDFSFLLWPHCIKYTLLVCQVEFPPCINCKEY